MPELPEVETVVRDLRPLLIGRGVRAIAAGPQRLRRPWNRDWEAQLLARRFTELTRRGKWIVARLDGGVLLVHLGMTGRLTAGDPSRPVEPHTHLTIDLDDSSQLRFRDPRRFGSAEWFASDNAVSRFLGERLGPEPFDLDPMQWREALAASRRCLKSLLLDQSVVAGVGNIYADEALFRAKLPPTRPACELSPREAERLRHSIAEVLTFAVEKRGSSIRDYVGGSGERGAFQTEFRAYGRTGEPCDRCGSLIVRTVIGGRATHFCPKCQGNV